MSYKPTCYFKWFPTPDWDKRKPVAAIRKDYRFDDELFCLKQLWINDSTEPDEWRDIEIAPEQNS